MEDTKKYTYRYGSDIEALFDIAQTRYSTNTLSSLIDRLILEAVKSLPEEINRLELDKKELTDKLNSFKSESSQMESNFNELKSLLKQQALAQNKIQSLIT